MAFLKAVMSVQDAVDEVFCSLVENSGNPVKPPQGFEPLYTRYRKYLTDWAIYVMHRCGVTNSDMMTLDAQRMFYEHLMVFEKFAKKEITVANFLGNDFQERFVEFLEEW